MVEKKEKKSKEKLAPTASIFLLSKEESCRIDVLKFLSIILVVYIHSYSEEINFASGSVPLHLPVWMSIFENILSQGIARMAVPMFFFISGVLLFRYQQSYKSMLVKKAKRLLVPYLIWNTLWIIVFVILQQLSFTKPFFSNPENNISAFQFKDWLNAYGFNLYKPPFLYPFWFIRDLIVLNIFYPLFNIALSKFPRFTLVLSIIVIFIPFDVPIISGVLGFFLIGGCAVKFNWRMEIIDKISYWPISAFYAMTLIFNFLIPGHLNKTLSILIGMVFFVKVSYFLYHRKCVYRVAISLIPYTFIIYAGHELTLSSFKKVCLKVLPNTTLVLFFQYFILPILIISGCIFIGRILNTHFTKIYTILTGEH